MGSTLLCPLRAPLGPNCLAQQPVTVWGWGAEVWPQGLWVREGPWDMAAELLCGYFSHPLLYTVCTHDPSWRREPAGVVALRGLPGHLRLDLPLGGCRRGWGQIQRCHEAPPAAPQSVSLELLGRFVQRTQLLVPGFCVGASAARCPAGYIKHL